MSGPAGDSLKDAGIVLTDYAGDTASSIPMPGAPSQAGSYTVEASFAGSADSAPASKGAHFSITAPTPTPTPTSTGTSPPPTILSEQVLTAGTRKHGKPSGIKLVFSRAPDAVRASNAANDVLTLSIQRGRKTVTAAVPIRVQHTAGSDDVSLMFAGPASFARGGPLRLVATPPGGVASAAGVAPDGGDQGTGGDDAVFTIRPRGSGISR